MTRIWRDVLAIVAVVIATTIFIIATALAAAHLSAPLTLCAFVAAVAAYAHIATRILEMPA